MEGGKEREGNEEYVKNDIYRKIFMLTKVSVCKRPARLVVV